MNFPLTTETLSSRKFQILNLIAVCLMVSLFSGAARASEYRGEHGDECAEKSRSLRAVLSQSRARARVWANAWGAAWSAATVAQFTLAGTTHALATRQDLIVGGVSSSLGLIPTWIVPPQVARSAASDDAPKGGDSCESLAVMQVLLARDQRNDAQNTGLLAHASNIAVNAAISLIMGAGLGHWNSAWVSSAAGIPLGELMIFTYPKTSETESSLHVSWTPSPTGQALTLTYSF